MTGFATTTPRAYEDKKSEAGLINAKWLADLEQRLRNPHVDPREYGAAVDSNGTAGNGTDDTEALEKATAAAITQKRPLYIPGKMRHSGPLVAATDNFHIFGLGRDISVLVPDDSSFDALTIGPGEGGAGVSPSGFARDFTIAGGNADVTAAGVDPATGKAALMLDGMQLFEIARVDVTGAHDVAFDMKNNCFGSRFVMARSDFESCRVGTNLRKGEESGEDISFYDCWLAGEVAAVQAASSGKNYRFIGGQVSAGRQLTGDEDERGVLILNKDYLTGETGEATEGEVHMQLATSFEFFPHVWAIRSFARVYLDLRSSFNPDGAGGPAIGFFKGQGFLNSSVSMSGCNIHGEWSNPAEGLVVLEGENGDCSWDEVGSYGRYEDSTDETNALWDPICLRARLECGGGRRNASELIFRNGLLLREDEGGLSFSNDWGETWEPVGSGAPGDEGETYASAGTLTVDSDVVLAKITGSTEIKKINATRDGHLVVFKFAEALTLKAGENLEIGSDFKATAGSALALVCDGTNWYRAGRPGNSAIKHRTSHTFVVDAEVTAKTVGGFWSQLASGQTTKLVALRYKIAEGTKAKIKLQKNGEDITGFKEKEATTSAAETTGEVTVGNNDLIELVVESVSGSPKKMYVTVILEHSV